MPRLFVDILVCFYSVEDPGTVLPVLSLLFACSVCVLFLYDVLTHCCQYGVFYAAVIRLRDMPRRVFSLSILPFGLDHCDLNFPLSVIFLYIVLNIYLSNLIHFIGLV